MDWSLVLGSSQGNWYFHGNDKNHQKNENNFARIRKLLPMPQLDYGVWQRERTRIKKCMFDLE